VGDKFHSIPENKRQQLAEIYQACFDVLEDLDKLLLHYNNLDSKSKRAWDRMKWDPERSRTLRQRLTASVTLLTGFYNSMIHDSQVLILEALGRLEREYRGGHREESIVSLQRIAEESAELEVNDDQEEEAWSRIIRDLEDVGITPQDTIQYRDFIVDWFVHAINEGRLVEAEPQALTTFPEDLGGALPSMPSLNSYNDPVEEPHQSPSMSSSNHQEYGARQHSTFMNQPNTVEQNGPLHQTHQSAIACNPQMRSSHLAVNHPSISEGETEFHSPSVNESPPNSSTKLDLSYNTQQILLAWEKRDFILAATHLEHQLAAVERGETIMVGGHIGQPDRRLLRHLIGICASYCGDFQKAKRMFNSVFNGIYLNGSNLDDGDIAAARWLGDACLHLHEPLNTAIAWGLAFVGNKIRYGETRSLTVCEELSLLDYCLHSMQRLEQSLKENKDPADIFMSAHVAEKYNLITTVIQSVRRGKFFYRQQIYEPRATSILPCRQVTAWQIPESMLLAPLLDTQLWPMKWDATFLPGDAIVMERYMIGPLDDHPRLPLSVRRLPSTGLASKKSSLHYVTKRSQEWLVENVKNGLQELGIEYMEQGTTVVCRILRQNNKFTSIEGEFSAVMATLATKPY